VSAAEARRALETGALGAAERTALAGDLDALMAAGEVSAAEALALVPLFARDPDLRVVSAGADLATGLGSLVPDALVPRFEAFMRTAYGERARALGWTRQPGEDENARLMRRDVMRVAASEGRDTELERQAAVLVGRWLDDPAVLDPDLVTTALAAATASGDRPLVTRLQQEAYRTTDRERRERLLDGLGGVREPGLARELLGLTLDDRIDPRESIRMLWRFGGHRETRRAAFDFLKANYDALVARLPQGELSPVQYFPWVGWALCADDTHAELEGFFGTRATAVMGGTRTLAQVLEAVDQCVARKRAQQGALAAYLEARPD
jgi:alanyl aminopeptidase